MVRYDMFGVNDSCLKAVRLKKIVRRKLGAVFAVFKALTRPVVPPTYLHLAYTVQHFIYKT